MEENKVKKDYKKSNNKGGFKKSFDKKKDNKKSFNKSKDDFKKSFDKKDDNKKSFNKSKDGFKKSYAKKDDSKKSFDRKPFNKDRKFNDKKDNFKKFDKVNEDVTNNEVTSDDNHIRYYIYKCLCNIYLDKAYSNIEIDHIIRENNINELDASLLTNIVYGTLAHDRILHWEIRKLCEKPPKDKARIILLMSLYQMKYLDRIPDFAIINEAVRIAKKEGGEAMGKFVNAILREAQRQNLVFSMEEATDENEYLSIVYNMPMWVIKMLIRHYGKEKTVEILKDGNVEAPLSCRVNIHKSSVEEILQNPDFVRGYLATNSVIYKGEAPIATTKEMKLGLVSVQDESSQYVVEVLDPKENQNILDMCAAPGSKTQYISELINNTGKILALDLHQHRVEIMKKYLSELGLKNIVCVCYDSTKLHEKKRLIGTFDKVLLDAPCMGLGVIRRKPDITLDLSEEKLDSIVETQSKLLEEAYLMLKNGGELVYSTCSINKKENDSQIMGFLARHSDMKRVFEKQIYVSDYNSDGFYICKLVKE